MVDGYRIHRVICERPDLHTLAEGVNRGGERVTLDAIARPLADDTDLRRRISRLARVRGSVDHPHLLRVIRTLDGGQRLHLQPLPATATTLADRLHSGPLAKDQALRLLGQVAGALETARMKGLVHRQLSPRAIFVTADDNPNALLTDFGIGAPRARSCELAGAVEEAPYRSPEEVRGEHPDAQSNVYTLACILVECLTGEPPFAYDRPLLTLYGHLTEPPPKVSARDSELPAALDNVINTAMAKDSRERHSSPGALIRAAEEALELQVAIPVVREARPRAAVVQEPPRPTARPPEPREPRRRRARTLGPAVRLGARRAGAATGRGLAALWPRSAPAWIGVGLVASAAAGFATGNTDLSGGVSPSGPAHTRAIVLPARSQAAGSVDRVVRQLDQRRTALRRKLRAARSPKQQATAAHALSAVYHDAGTRLRREPGADALIERLHLVALAYGRMAAAARAIDPSAWLAAREQALDQERDLELLLRTRKWT